MEIRQIVLGASIAGILVLGADAATPARAAAVSSSAICGLDGVRQAVRIRAERASEAVLDAVLNAVGDLEARIKQVF